MEKPSTSIEQIALEIAIKRRGNKDKPILEQELVPHPVEYISAILEYLDQHNQDSMESSDDFILEEVKACKINDPDCEACQ